MDSPGVGLITLISPCSSPGGTKTGLERAAEIEPSPGADPEGGLRGLQPPTRQ